MGFFGWLLVIFGGMWLTGKLFGKQIARWAFSRLQARAMKEMERQSNAFSQNYPNPDGKRSTKINEDVSVEYTEKTPQLDKDPRSGIAEDVEFEEV